MVTEVTYAQLVEILNAHDSRFVMSVGHEIVDGKQEEKRELRHRMLHHPDVSGRSRHLPVPYDGEDRLIGVRTLKAIVRRFELPSEVFEKGGDDGGGSS